MGIGREKDGHEARLQQKRTRRPIAKREEDIPILVVCRVDRQTLDGANLDNLLTLRQALHVGEFFVRLEKSILTCSRRVCLKNCEYILAQDRNLKLVAFLELSGSVSKLRFPGLKNVFEKRQSSL